MRTESDDRFDHALQRWIPLQRWFGSKGKPISSVRIVLRDTLLDTDDLRVEHLLVAVEFTDHEPEIYQIPLAFRPTVTDELSPWVVDPDADVLAYDGMRDPDVIALYADALAAGRSADVRFRTVDGSAVAAGLAGRVLGAEQSNTSVILGETLLLKIFRKVEIGINPDVELHRALSSVHCAYVATLQGWLEAEVNGATTTLGMAQDFVAGAREGWTAALESVAAAGHDFTDESRLLGRAVAAVHADLATSEGTNPPAPPAATVEAILARIDAATMVVPELRESIPAARALIDEALHSGDVTAQRIHGDLHLGQVLRTADRWLLIDFEGEPAKTFEERRTPDSPLRDVAGMLRSYDYAASHGEDPAAAREWYERNVSAFCEGYAAVAGHDPREQSALLRAYELDKAVYEAVYEARNRPTWLPIPLTAIARLVR